MHLGMYPENKSREREHLFVSWLDTIKNEASAIYLVGDVFDFWWEYHKAVPRGFVRTLGKLAEFGDMGTEIHFFTGNHDMWAGTYLEKEVGLIIHPQAVKCEIAGKTFYIAHGDGLGKGDYGYKMLKAIFRSRILQWFFARLHPNLAITLAHAWARNSRYSKGFDENFNGEEKEILLQYAKEMLLKEKIDFFIFGHRHIAYKQEISNTCSFVYLGDWITNFSYAVFDGNVLALKNYIAPTKKYLMI